MDIEETIKLLIGARVARASILPLAPAGGWPKSLQIEFEGGAVLRAHLRDSITIATSDATITGYSPETAAVLIDVIRDDLQR